MAGTRYVSARDGEKNSVIYKTADGQEFIHSGGSRAWRNHNPGNLTSAEKSGLKIGAGGRFAAFATLQDGMAALKYALTRFYSDRTLDKVFEKYAPSSDNNDPERYIKQVKQFSGLDSSQKLGDLNDADLQKFMNAIKRVEGWIIGKIDPVPHARQFVVKGVDDAPLPGIAYEMVFFTGSGEEKKLCGTTDVNGQTEVARSDIRTPVLLKLPRPDPGQSLKAVGLKGKTAASMLITAAEVRSKPWYEPVFLCVADSEDRRDEPASAISVTATIEAKPTPGVAESIDGKTASGPAKAASGPNGTAAAAVVAPAPKAPVATVKQAGAVKASGTKEKSQNYVEGVVKEAGVFVTWQFNTSGGSGKVLNGLPYFIAEIAGPTSKPLVQNQRVRLMRDNKIRQKVPYGKEVALYLGNDAKSQYRTTPLFKVKVDEGLTDIVVKVAETSGKKYDAARELPHNEQTAGTKRTFSAMLYGRTWMKFSHKFSGSEAKAEGAGELPEISTALQQIYEGAPTASATTITLSVTKPNKKQLKIVWPSSAFGNAMANITTIASLTDAKNEIIPRVHPQTYKAFLKAAFEIDAEEMEINSGWRPMLGSVLHRIGVGLDVGRIKANGGNQNFSRSSTAAEKEYAKLMAEKRTLTAKKVLTALETKRLSEIKAIESAKAAAATNSIRDNESGTLRSFTSKLRANADVKQTFDPWEMDVNTGDKTPPAPNRLVTGNETLHRTHLHITVRDTELGH